MSLRPVAYLAILCNVLVTSVLAWRVATVAENHWGLSHPRLTPVLALELLALAWPRLGLTRRLRLAALLSGSVALVTVVAVTQLNALLPYDLWIRRGMPGKWEGFRAWSALRTPAGKYAEFASPDGALRVVVMRSASWGGVAPGHGGDAPGYAMLVVGNGVELRREAVGSVNQVQPAWEQGAVRLTPFVRWRLHGDACMPDR